MNYSGINPSIIIVGAGGHGHVVADLSRRVGYNVDGFLDGDVKLMHEEIPILGDDDFLKKLTAQQHIAMGIAARGRWDRRTGLCNNVDHLGLSAPSLIDPSATVASSVTIGRGTQIFMGARIQNGASVKEWSVINTASVIEHDCVIEAHAHIAPGAILCGGVTIGEGSLVGAGSIVKEGVSVGSRVTIGLGAVVLDDVADGQTVVGVPARRIHVHP